MLWLIWLVAAIAFIWSDVHVQAFYAFFLGLGAAAACLSAAFGAQLWVQGALFAAVSLTGVGLLRPPLTHWLEARTGRLPVLPGTHGGFIGQLTDTLDAVGDEQ